MTRGRVLAGVVLAVVLVPVAILPAFGVLLGGCAHDCSSRQTAAQIGLAVLASLTVLAILGVGLVGLRRWPWPAIFAYLVGLVVLARVTEFVFTRF